MKFALLQYIWFFWLVILIGLFLFFAEWHRLRRVGKFIAPMLWAEALPPGLTAKRRLKNGLILLALVFAVFALMRPQWGYHLREFKRRGVDIYVLVDVSQSMNATDIVPSRMERAKRELIDLLDMMEGDRLGLIAFAGLSYVACPLTTDYNAFRLFVDELDTELVPVQGTDISGAIGLALKSFEKGDSRSKAVLLITDGESTTGDLGAILGEAKKEEIRLFVMGVGTDKGAPIPLAEGGGFKEDKSGRMVVSKLNELSLQRLALDGGGTYVRSVSGDEDLHEIYLKGIKQALEKKELKSGKKIVPEERFQIPLLLAVVLLFITLGLGETGKERKDKG